MIEKIISGGQTGVDQAALRAATEIGVSIGGWCPKGGLDENAKNIRDQYSNLQETSTSNPDERTKLNIQDSDGTLIIVPSLLVLEKIKDGTALTIDYANNQKKPLLIIDISHAENASEVLLEWVNANYIRTLNIAGPRESNSPGIYDAACALLKNIFFQLKIFPKF